ncbi:hypothetical protein [Dyadobacter sp. 3J3]|uniref:hypothetical protein n=1 Tax=Dyadobacter sp. 3J3 TaxID=2606600 RepID=UPI0013582D1D|nr:hypothetical protein [Dyadobacter sp. 3J3]
MTKREKRQLIYDKFDGKCAYCGCDLNGKFHIDEIEPCRRKQKMIPAHWTNGNPTTENDTSTAFVTSRWVNDGFENPEAFRIENQNPSCASCNINKHSMSLEEFRKLIAGFMKHLNEINTQYKIAKRYGLVSETNEEVKFYFELYEEDRI